MFAPRSTLLGFRTGSAFALCLATFVSLAGAQEEPGDLLAERRIAAGQGGLDIVLADDDEFGRSVVSLGDLDGDGVDDLMVGYRDEESPPPGDGINGPYRQGALAVLFLATDGSVQSSQRIGANDGGFGGLLGGTDEFGSALATIGDLDGDGVVDVAVGARRTNDGGTHRGAVWILFMNADGTVKAEQKIAHGQGGLQTGLQNQDEFGASVAFLDDLDGDGVGDIAVGSRGYDAGGANGNNYGAVHVLLLNADGTVKAEQRISLGEGGFLGALDTDDEFGFSLAALGDMDGDGLTELAVGARNDDDGGSQHGAVYILFLASDGTVKAEQKISATAGGLAGPLDEDDEFGYAVTAMGDVDGDAVPDLAVGARRDDEGGTQTGAAYLLFLNEDGTVGSERKFSATSGGVAGPIAAGDEFGAALGATGVLEDGTIGFLVGAGQTDDGGSDTGALYVLFLRGPPQSQTYVPPTVESFSGRPGRSTLLLPPPSPGDDCVCEPIVSTPRRDNDSMTIEGGQPTFDDTTGESGTDFSSGGDYPTGDDPSQSGTGGFGGGGFGDSADGEATAYFSDVVVANEGSDDFSLLQALPGGTYAPQVRFSLLPMNAAPVALQVGDFDNDSNDDVALAGNQGVSVFLGDGLGGFPVSTFTPVTLLNDIAVDDLNGDEILDIVAASGRRLSGPGEPEEGFVTVLLGNGDGTFANVGGADLGRAVASVLLGDLVGDPSVDAMVAVHEFGSGPMGVPLGRIEVLEGDGLGGLAPSSWAGVDVPSAQGIHPTFGSLADLNGDGLMDAAYTSSDNVSRPLQEFAEEQPALVLTILVNDGLGGFGVSELGTAYVGRGDAPILEDTVLDPDENIDSILIWYDNVEAGLGGLAYEGSGFTTFITVLAGDGEASFVDPAGNQYDTGNQPGDGAIGELDTAQGAALAGDGEVLTLEPERPDVAIPNFGDNTITFLNGDGDGGIRSELLLEDVDVMLPQGMGTVGPRSVSLGRLDGDGATDLVSYNELRIDGEFGGASLSLFVNGPNAGKTQNLRIPRGGEMGPLADVTRDGLQDVVVTQRLGIPPGGDGSTVLVDEVRVYPGLGDGRVGPALVFEAPEGQRLTGGIIVRDLDGDGAPEVITTSADLESDEGQLLVYANGFGAAEGQGSLTATLTPLNGTWTEVRSIDVGDVTGDGRLDVAVGVADARLFVAGGLESEGAAEFEVVPLPASVAVAGGGALRIGDLDGDGLADIISSNGTTDDVVDQAFVRVVFSRGGGEFAVQTIAGLSSIGPLGTLRPLLADLNGDLATDLVLLHGTSNSMSILLNQLSRFERYGEGKPGSAGFTPQLGGLGYTTPGGQGALVLEEALGGAPALLRVGTGAIPDEFLAIDNVLVQVFVSLGGTPGAAGEGTFQLPYVLPESAEIVGAEIAIQFLVGDPGASAAPEGIAASNGLTMTIVQ